MMDPQPAHCDLLLPKLVVVIAVNSLLSLVVVVVEEKIYFLIDYCLV